MEWQDGMARQDGGHTAGTSRVGGVRWQCRAMLLLALSRGFSCGPLGQYNAMQAGEGVCHAVGSVGGGWWGDAQGHPFTARSMGGLAQGKGETLLHDLVGKGFIWIPVPVPPGRAGCGGQPVSAPH